MQTGGPHYSLKIHGACRKRQGQMFQDRGIIICLREQTFETAGYILPTETVSLSVALSYLCAIQYVMTDDIAAAMATVAAIMMRDGSSDMIVCS
jgi:hypothetical protein